MIATDFWKVHKLMLDSIITVCDFFAGQFSPCQYKLLITNNFSNKIKYFCDQETVKPTIICQATPKISIANKLKIQPKSKPLTKRILPKAAKMERMWYMV